VMWTSQTCRARGGKQAVRDPLVFTMCRGVMPITALNWGGPPQSYRVGPTQCVCGNSVWGLTARCWLEGTAASGWPCIPLIEIEIAGATGGYPKYLGPRAKTANRKAPMALFQRADLRPGGAAPRFRQGAGSCGGEVSRGCHRVDGFWLCASHLARRGDFGQCPTRSHPSSCISASTPEGLSLLASRWDRLMPPNGRPNEYVWGPSEASGDCATARQRGQSDGQDRSHSN
jgi:hypothetical protein